MKVNSLLSEGSCGLRFYDTTFFVPFNSGVRSDDATYYSDWSINGVTAASMVRGTRVITIGHPSRLGDHRTVAVNFCAPHDFFFSQAGTSVWYRYDNLNEGQCIYYCQLLVNYGYPCTSVNLVNLSGTNICIFNAFNPSSGTTIPARSFTGRVIPCSFKLMQQHFEVMSCQSYLILRKIILFQNLP